MRRSLLMTVATIALIAGMNVASAQSGGEQPHMQNSPGGKGEETIKPGVHQNEPGATVRRDQNEKSNKMSQGQQGQNEAQPRREGQATPMDQNGPRGGNQEKMGRDNAQGQVPMEQKERTTQQDRGSAKSAQLSSEQRAKIHATITNQKAERLPNVNFTVRVGARVPRSVHFYPLPIEIVDVVPEYEGYDYVLAGDEILIIDPNTLEIVAVLPA